MQTQGWERQAEKVESCVDSIKRVLEKLNTTTGDAIKAQSCVSNLIFQSVWDQSYLCERISNNIVFCWRKTISKLSS